MESKLTVKNFGPIKSVELKLRNVNVFIGPQATGKSALAKIYTIFKAPRKFFYKKEGDNEEVVIDNNKASKEVKDVFKQYNINSFLTPRTEIEFESELHTITYKLGILNYKPKLLNDISEIEELSKNFDLNRKHITEGFIKFGQKFVLFDIRADMIINKDKTPPTLSTNFEEISEDQCKDLISIIKPIEDDLSTSTAVYIPAERNFVNIIKKSALNLILNKVPIPQHILSFGAELEKLEFKEIDLNFIQKGLKYRIIEGEDRIYINDKQSIMLTEAASGIQSVVPLLASTFEKSGVIHRSFVIEEPELNLFPIAQYELIKYLESKRKDPHSIWEDYGTIHTYTTHSPYILSSINNLLYAYKVEAKLNSELAFNKNNNSKRTANSERVKSIVKATINPKSFTAYQICDGLAKSIFNEEVGLIEDNYIDAATDTINEDFEALMELSQ